MDKRTFGFQIAALYHFFIVLFSKGFSAGKSFLWILLAFWREQTSHNHSHYPSTRPSHRDILLHLWHRRPNFYGLFGLGSLEVAAQSHRRRRHRAGVIKPSQYWDEKRHLALEAKIQVTITRRFPSHSLDRCHKNQRLWG